MFEKYRCQMRDHNEQQIIGMCQNQNCQQPSRLLCFECIKDHEKYDKKFNINDIKNEKGIQMLIDEFKDYKLDFINNTILQCEIQQYLLHIQLIEYVKLWNFKFNELNNILEQINNFNQQKWNQIGLMDFMQKKPQNISIHHYLEQFLKEILRFDDMKDNYIKQIINKQQYDQDVVIHKQNLFTNELIKNAKINQIKLFDKIKTNVNFKKIQKKESPVATLCEIFLRQGYYLQTNNMFNFFQQYCNTILQNQLEEYQIIQIRSLALLFKCDSKENSEEGLQLIEYCINEKIKNPQLFFIKGSFLNDQKKYVEGLKQLEISLSLDPQYIPSLLNKGWTLYLLDKDQDSIQVNNQILQIDSKFYKAYLNIGTALEYQKKYKHAIDMYDQVIKINPKYIEAYYKKGNSLYQLELYDEAIEQYDKVLLLDNKYIDAYEQKGYALLGLEQFEAAIEQFDKFTDLDPTNADIFCIKGNAYEKLGKQEQAINNYIQSIQLDPDQIDTYNQIAQLLLSVKEYQHAKKYLEQYLQKQPDDEEAQEQLLEIITHQLK